MAQPDAASAATGVAAPQHGAEGAAVVADAGDHAHATGAKPAAAHCQGTAAAAEPEDEGDEADPEWWLDGNRKGQLSAIHERIVNALP